MRSHRPWLALVVVAGCGDGGVRYAVGLGAQDGIVVTVDGVETEEAVYAVEYRDTIEASEAPVLEVETWRDGVRVDGIEIGIGACVRWCEMAGVRDCETEDDVIVEQVAAPFDADGVFLGGFDDPRAWRGVGCLECRLAGGGLFFVCS